jgi:hypothetical protein
VIIGTSQTVIYGVAACTTALALIAISMKAIVHPKEALEFAFESTKGLFTAVLQGLNVIQDGADLAQPSVVILSIISVALASIGYGIGMKVYEKFISQYEPRVINLPFNVKSEISTGYQYDMIALVNSLQDLKYILIAIVALQLLSIIRYELGRDNKDIRA